MNFLSFIMLFACWTRQSVSPTVEPILRPEVTLDISEVQLYSGRVENDLFQDSLYPFGGEVPSGWQAEFGPKYGTLRIRLKHEESGTIVEVWRFRDQLTRPAPRSNCSWDFVDKGLYRVKTVEELVVVATCTPLDAMAPFVFAGLHQRDEGTWQFETHAPQTSLLSSKKLGEELLKNFKWRSVDDASQEPAP